MFQIDDRYIDVDFTKEPEFVGGALEPNLFGFTAYEDAVPILSEAEIRAAIEVMDDQDSGLEWLVAWILNQQREGSCVGFGTVGAMLAKYAEQYGLDELIELSPMSLYKRIGRSAQSGATISDGIEEAASRGVLPLDTPTNRELFGSAVMDATGFDQRFPSDWELTARRFRVDEWHVARSTAGIWTALANRDPVIVGREGHCIYYVRPVWQNGELSALYGNSWGRWGMAAGRHDHGFGLDTMRQVIKSANWAIVVRSVVNPGTINWSRTS